MLKRPSSKRIAEVDRMIREVRRLRRSWERSRGLAPYASVWDVVVFDEVVVHLEDPEC